MPRITISYRRSDSAGITGRIYDRLTTHFGDGSVFMDIDTIPLGVDFRKYVDGALKQTDFLLVVIGSQWLGPRTDGPNRIDDGNDPVRVEIAAGLRNGVTTVIPLLIDNVPMPTPSMLPEELRDLSYVNAAEISSGRDFTTHVTRVIRFIDDTFRLREEEQAAATAEAEAQRGAEQAAEEQQRPEQGAKREEELRASAAAKLDEDRRAAQAVAVEKSRYTKDAAALGALFNSAIRVSRRFPFNLLLVGVVAVLVGVAVRDVWLAKSHAVISRPPASANPRSIAKVLRAPVPATKPAQRPAATPKPTPTAKALLTPTAKPTSNSQPLKESAGPSGSWAGTVTQDHPAETYPVEMELNRSTGSISYPSLACGGTLAFIAYQGGTFSYREHITRGTKKCTEGGTIQFRQIPDNNTSWDWRWEAAGVIVRGVLHARSTSKEQG